MSGPCRVLILAVGLGIGLMPPAAFAQQGTAALQGAITDSSGGALPGATVTARNLDTGVPRVAVTDDAGRFRMVALPAGAYDVHAELSGFQSAVRSSVRLPVGAEISVDLQLGLGGVAETVTVAGTSPVIEVTRSHVAAVIG